MWIFGDSVLVTKGGVAACTEQFTKALLFTNVLAPLHSSTTRFWNRWEVTQAATQPSPRFTSYFSSSTSWASSFLVALSHLHYRLRNSRNLHDTPNPLRHSTHLHRHTNLPHCSTRSLSRHSRNGRSGTVTANAASFWMALFSSKFFA